MCDFSLVKSFSNYLHNMVSREELTRSAVVLKVLIQIFRTRLKSQSSTPHFCPSGVIGSRVRLKIEFFRECWFKSSLGHNMKNNNILVVTGPTATGKSALAVEIAKLYNGEIISADSRQVYTGLDIGSAKITHDEMDSVPHHMIDIADPTSEVFTVADFQALAREKIHDIRSRGKLPILCGGTGMYIDATIFDMQFPTVEPDHALRAKLEQKTTDELFNMLVAVDPHRASNIDHHNRVRLVRAIEVADSPSPAKGKGGVGFDNKAPSDLSATSPFARGGYNTLWIGLQLPKETMLERIRTRITNRIPALFDEIQHLQGIGVSDERLHGFGLEYRYGLMYIQHKITENEFTELLTTKTWQFSKRQMTWFKRNTEIKWLNPITDKQKILERVKEFLG